MHTNHLIAYTSEGEKYFAEECTCFNGLIWLTISRDKDGIVENIEFVKPGYEDNQKIIGLFFHNGFLYLQSCYVKKPQAFRTFKEWKEFHEKHIGLMKVEEIFLYQVILNSGMDDCDKGIVPANSKEVEELFKTLRNMLEPKFDFMKTEDWIEKIQNLNETLIAADSGNEETFMELLDLQYEGIKVGIAARHNELSEEVQENLKSAQEKINNLLNYFTSSN